MRVQIDEFAIDLSAMAAFGPIPRQWMWQLPARKQGRETCGDDRWWACNSPETRRKNATPALRQNDEQTGVGQPSCVRQVVGQVGGVIITTSAISYRAAFDFNASTEPLHPGKFETDAKWGFANCTTRGAANDFDACRTV